MAAGAKKLVAVALVACASLSSARQPAPAQRIVSLVPALTEMLFAIGAGSHVVGVSSYDEFPPEVTRLPKVGALLNPDTERILALGPDLVLIYGSQRDQAQQFSRAGIRTYSYRHGGVASVLESIRALGGLTGRSADASRLAASIETDLQSVRRRVAGRTRPRVLLAFQRQEATLRDVYASGGRGFLHEILEIAGGQNVFAEVDRESVQPSTETLLSLAPDVIIELRVTGRLDPQSLLAERAVWSTLASAPAVRNGRVYILGGQYLVSPGPRLARAAQALATAIHP